MVDWTKPLELEDGTPVVLIHGPDRDGDYRLRREDNLYFTEHQTGGRFKFAHWQKDGFRLSGCAGLMVRNRFHTHTYDFSGMTITGLPVPDGFAEVMKHTITGDKITGIVIDAPYSLSIQTPNGTFEFRITQIN